MGLRSWKRVIFAWVQKCGFVDEHFLTLEQSNINIFFLRYLEYDHMEIFLDTVSTQGSDRATPLIQFLKDVYPDFCPNLDRSGNLDRTDHLMVYTLMLHYACVIKKSEKYQLICTELSESMQRSIASFLRHIVDSQKITRNCLKDALQTSPKFVHPRNIASPDTSISNSHTVVASIPQTPGTPVTLDTASPQTPTETPSHTSGNSPLPICDCAKLTYSVEEHRMNGSQLQSSIDALTANTIELEESLVQPARHIEDNEQMNAYLVAQQDMEQARNLSHELALGHAQNATNLKKMEAKVVEWRQKYESILKKSLANEAETNENERKRQDLVESSNISMTEMRSKIDALEEKYRESQTNYGQLLFERNNRDVQYENERIEIELKLANCCRELDDRNDSHALLLKKYENRMEELNDLKLERDTLMEVAKQHKMELSEFQKMLAQANNVTKEKELLHRELIDLQKKTEQDAETITIIKDYKDLLLVKRNTLDEQHQKELVNVDLMLANCRQKLDEQNESYAMLLKERDTLMEATKQNTKELSRVQQKLEQQQKQQENMQEELKQKDAQIEALRKEKEMMRKSERTVRKDLNVLINKTDEKEAHLNLEIGSLNLQLMLTNQRLEQLVHQTETHDGEVAQLQVKIAEDGQALEAANQEQLCLQMELQSRRALMATIEHAHKLENKSLKQQAKLLQCTLQEILQVKMELQSNLLKQQDEHNKQLKLYEDQLEESENRYAFLQVNMTAQQKTSEELQIQLSQQLNVTKKDLADAMERLNATYTASAEEEGLPDRSTLQQNCQVLQAKYQEAKK
ncbi:testis-specific gene 10 protein-like [Drosophila guanche]|uniref:testis-specific gene 10 protein-like n=1 Tax=Drosophila guanche TaxID=7266 RepID=UPI0014708C6B|nr:testis-specific gene 10 protein-like [Drosophila guanche]